MIAARVASRSARAVRLPAQAPARTCLRQARFQSTTSSSTNAANASKASNASSSSQSSSNYSHYVAGAVGGLAGAAALYGVYYVTPAGRMARRLNKTASDAEATYNEAAQKLREKAPTSADQAIESIKSFAMTYAGWVPGGRDYVEAAFRDVDKVREKHGDEADKILNDAYKRMQEASKSGMSMETAAKAWEVLADVSSKIAGLAGDAAGDILENHPKLKEKVGGNADKLKQMGEQYGPEAKKMVDDTWAQMRDIVSGGLTVESLEKARKLVEEKVQQVQKLGDEAWKKGLEQAKPLLDKNPRAKKLFEENADALKQGNVKELFERARKTVESGDLGSLEEYVNQAVDKAKKTAGGSGIGGGLEKYLGAIPNGSEIMSKLQKLGEVASKRGDEGEKLLKETVDELKQVLEEKGKRAEEIASEAKKDAT